MLSKFGVTGRGGRQAAIVVSALGLGLACALPASAATTASSSL